MKKALIILLFLFLTILLFSCKNITIDHIEIEQALTETVTTSTKYKPSENIKVYAVFSDQTKKDVTRESIFNLDTSTAGIKDCVVTYQNHEIAYKVTVIDKNTRIMELNLSGVICDYVVGDELSFSNLQVRILYSNGKYEDILDFDYEVTDSNGDKIDPNFPFNKAGTYTVTIIYEELKQSYEIRVMFYKSISFDFIKLDSNRTFENGRYKFKNYFEGIIEDELVVFSLLGENTYYEKNNYLNQPINVTCYDQVYNRRLNISVQDRGFKLELRRDCELSIIADSTNKLPIKLYSLKNEYTPIENPYDSLTMYSFSMEQGTYFLKTNNESFYIYNMILTFDSI